MGQDGFIEAHFKLAITYVLVIQSFRDLCHTQSIYTSILLMHNYASTSYGYKNTQLFPLGGRAAPGYPIFHYKRNDYSRNHGVSLNIPQTHILRKRMGWQSELCKRRKDCGDRSVELPCVALQCNRRITCSGTNGSSTRHTTARCERTIVATSTSRWGHPKLRPTCQNDVQAMLRTETRCTQITVVTKWRTSVAKIGWGEAVVDTKHCVQTPCYGHDNEPCWDCRIDMLCFACNKIIIIRRRTFIKRHNSRNVHSETLYMSIYIHVS